MNNNNPINLINENGVPKEYGEIPDLWHIAMSVADANVDHLTELQRKTQSENILEVWHMAHDLKACVEGQGQARITDKVEAA